jgi:hypothetical protein
MKLKNRSIRSISKLGKTPASFNSDLVVATSSPLFRCDIALSVDVLAAFLQILSVNATAQLSVYRI